jgi:hypothetical protein
MRGVEARDEKDQKREVLETIRQYGALPKTTIQGWTGIPHKKLEVILRWAECRGFLARIEKEAVEQYYEPIRRKPDAVFILTPEGFRFLQSSEVVFEQLRMPLRSI